MLAARAVAPGLRGARRPRRRRDQDVLHRDWLCPGARFDTLREGFGERFREVVVPGRKHSVLTLHWKDLSDADKTRVCGELTGFLRERLQPG